MLNWILVGLENDNFFGCWLFGFSYFFELGFHMRYHLFLHYGWFLQNLGKDFIRTNMHTTVYSRTLLKASTLPIGKSRWLQKSS